MDIILLGLFLSAPFRGGEMKKWIISFGYPDGTEERREFWAASGDDCYRAIRAECKCCAAGYQRA